MVCRGCVSTLPKAPRQVDQRERQDLGRPSAKLKAFKKAAKKATQEQAIPGAEPKKLGKEEATEAPPLPPPAGAEAPASDDPLLVQEAIVTSEAAGKLYFAKEKITFFSEAGSYTMVTGSGVFQIKPEWLQLKSSKWTQLSKNDLKLWLSQMSCNPDDQLGTSPEEWSTHTVLPCPHNKLEMEDQHIWLGWCLLS